MYMYVYSHLPVCKCMFIVINKETAVNTKLNFKKSFRIQDVNKHTCTYRTM
jgi:hypothetical protein